MCIGIYWRGRINFSSTLIGFLAGPEKSTGKDRLTREEHINLFNVIVTQHRRFCKEMKTQRNS